MDESVDDNSLEHILNVVIGVSLLEQAIRGVAHEYLGLDMGHSELCPVVVVPGEVQVEQEQGQTD